MPFIVWDGTSHVNADCPKKVVSESKETIPCIEILFHITGYNKIKLKHSRHERKTLALQLNVGNKGSAGLPLLWQTHIQTTPISCVIILFRLKQVLEIAELAEDASPDLFEILLPFQVLPGLV